MKVAILLTDLFEQVEMTEPRKTLDQAGATTHLIAPDSGEVQGAHHDKKGDKFPVDLTLDQAKADDYEAVLLPGGVMNSDALRMEEAAQEFVQQIDAAGKPIAVICHGPWLLISSGLVAGRKMTSFHSIQDDLKNAGADWSDQEVVVDETWVSSRKPDDIPAFNEAMLKLFAQRPVSA